jgi:non-heme chloroperoxidase
VARHFGKYGSKGVSKAVIISGVPPYLLKTPDNPGGLDASVFDGIEQAVQANWNIAAGASAIASLACVQTWHEDFREDLTRIDVPTLVIHGDTDRILPIAATGLRTAKLIKGARLLVVKDGPHCIPCRHAEEVNAELMSFLGGKTGNLQKEVA